VGKPILLESVVPELSPDFVEVTMYDAVPQNDPMTYKFHGTALSVGQQSSHAILLYSQWVPG
jgi:hypothetical protein